MRYLCPFTFTGRLRDESHLTKLLIFQTIISFGVLKSKKGSYACTHQLCAFQQADENHVKPIK